MNDSEQRIYEEDKHIMDLEKEFGLNITKKCKTAEDFKLQDKTDKVEIIQVGDTITTGKLGSRAIGVKGNNGVATRNVINDCLTKALVECNEQQNTAEPEELLIKIGRVHALHFLVEKMISKEEDDKRYAVEVLLPYIQKKPSASLDINSKNPLTGGVVDQLFDEKLGEIRKESDTDVVS